MAPKISSTVLTALFSFTSACAAEDDPDGETAGDFGTMTPATQDGPGAESSPGDDAPSAGDATHGVVKLELHRAQNEAASPFLGTASVSITLDYLDCLIAFYDTQPEWGMVGPMGAQVFDEWNDRLCSDYTGPADAKCTVASMSQELDVSKHLTVTYDVTTQPDLENLVLYFGPLPTAELAMCDGGRDPIVRVGSYSAVRGHDADGAIVWEMTSFDPDKAGTNQGQVIEVLASLPN